MAHGKETPRQKMIGMMYLILTALLALNVSKEAVEAFKRVDEGLNKTTQNFMQQNKSVYADFEQKAVANPQKAGQWLDVAKQVRERTNELFNLMEALKIEIVQKADGKDAPALEGGKLNVEKIKKIDDNNVPSEVLIGSNNNGKAYALKAAIIDYRSFLLDIIGEGHPAVTQDIENILETSDVKEHDQVVGWEEHNFHTLPLIAVITILSKFQNDVRNAEADMLDFLFNQIEAKDFKVNKLGPIVIGPNYVMRGSEYQAKVFIAATDSTQKPTIQVGKYNVVKAANGTKSYQMVGSATKLPVDQSGMGIFKLTPTSTGEKTWGGLISLKRPDGSTISFPFEGSYTVAEPNVVVSPTAMNVFYIGVDNPVAISVPGVGQNQIKAVMSNGRLVRGKYKNFPGSWIAHPQTAGKIARITVSATINGKNRTFPARSFRVKNVPDPVAKVAGLKGGSVRLAVLKAQQGVIAEMENFDFDLRFKVTSFRVSINDKGYVIDQDSKNNLFTSAQKALFNRLKRNSQVIIQEIKAVGPDGKPRKLSPIVLKIQ